MIWIKRLCLFLGAALLLSVLAVALWLGLKVFFYQQQDNETHLLEKQSYLEKVGKLDRAAGRPNIVFILFDDLGYGDLGFTGSTAIRTPAMDELARDGINMSQYYSPAPVCTPARAGLLTGRFPVRAGMPNVVFPSTSPISSIAKLSGANNRFPAEEITIADALKAAGYATGMVGKWHLGDQSPSLPNDLGFDSFFGALYSNDMTPFALYRNRAVEVEAPADQTRLNEWYGGEAERFIAQNKSSPFFLYFAHNFPHIPLYTPDEDKKRSDAGVYGDVVEGLDDVVARVVASLKANGVYENTILLISSDNGPWYQGSPGNSRGRKADIYEGGVHVPMVVNWPARLKGGRTLNGISMGTDWFPTLLDWLNIPLPIDRIIDVFPAEEKSMVRSMLSESLRSVIAQKLLKRVGGGRVACHEIMMATPAIRNLIREDKVAQMYSIIQTGAAHGMQTMEQNAKQLMAQGLVDSEEVEKKIEIETSRF